MLHELTSISTQGRSFATTCPWKGGHRYIFLCVNIWWFIYCFRTCPATRCCYTLPYMKGVWFLLLLHVVVCIACPFRVSTPRCSRVARGTGFDSKRLPVQARSHVLSKMVDQASFLAGSAFLERPWERGCSWFRSSILPLTGFVPCNLEFNSLAALVCK